MEMRINKNLLLGVIGNVLEWYDFIIYAYLSPIISQLFFPKNDQHALLKTLMVFAIGYLARPFGGILFGYIGDRLGRKLALQLSILITGIPSVLIALLPSYQQIGYASMLLLLALRLIQGVAAGGELITSTVYTYETAPKGKQGFYCSWVTVSSIAGALTASIVTALLHIFFNDQQMLSMWRIAFLLGFLLVIFGAYARRHLQQSADFLTLKSEDKRSNVIETIRHAYRPILQVMGFNVFVGVSFYLLFIFAPTYLSVLLGSHSHLMSLLVNSFSLVVIIILIPFAGMLSDKIGRRKVAIWSCLAIAASAYPLFHLMVNTDSVWIILLAFVAFAIFMSGIEGVLTASMASLFKIYHRVTGIGFAYNISTCAFGGTAPAICFYLVQKYSNMAPAYYLMAASVIALPAFLTMPKENSG